MLVSTMGATVGKEENRTPFLNNLVTINKLCYSFEILVNPGSKSRLLSDLVTRHSRDIMTLGNINLAKSIHFPKNHQISNQQETIPQFQVTTKPRQPLNTNPI